MKTTAAPCRVGPHGTRRSGVTLIELMVVMMVISILASLLLSGLMVAKSNAAIAKTASTIRKLHEVIIPYYEEFETRRPVLPDVTELLKLPRGRTLLTDLRQVATRRLMTMELPERPSDITATLATGPQGHLPYDKKYGAITCSLSEVPPVARRYQSIISSLGPGNVANNAELLHLIVTRGPVADADVVAHFRPDEVSDLDRDGLPEFIDGWGKPIQFRRWPIGFNSPAQPIDGTRRTVDAWLSNRGHRLVPLIFSGGPDRTPDLELMPDLTYAAFDFDPFKFDPSAASDPAKSPIRAAENARRVRGEVVLTPVTRSGDGPLTFFAARLDGSGQFPVPPLEEDCTARPSDAFFTVGSERDVGSADSDVPNGVVESLDNIHNHDLGK